MRETRNLSVKPSLKEKRRKRWSILSETGGSVPDLQINLVKKTVNRLESDLVDAVVSFSPDRIDGGLPAQ